MIRHCSTERLKKIFFVLDSHSLRQASDCGTYQWKCLNGDCINDDELCDGEANCSDESDESIKVCNSIYCPSYAYRCSYGACVDGNAECNGKQECIDNSDELSLKCPGVLESIQAQGNCSDYNIQCGSGECITEDLVCDGSVDCRDGSDETAKRCVSAYCPSYGFRCEYGGCISGKSKCDGHVDCADGSDEDPRMCGYKHTTPMTTTMPPDVIVPGSCTIGKLPENLKVFYESAPDVELHSDEKVEPFASVTYQCGKKYSLVGNNTNFCIDGNWVNNLPECKKFCSAVTISGISIKTACEFDGTSIPCSDNLIPGTIARLTCQFGYKKPQDTVQDVLVCEDTGNWDYYAFRCEQVCGTEAAEGVSYVVGGTKTNITKVPWHAALFNNVKEKGRFTQMCGGTILSAKVVISAAHCFWDSTEGRFFDAHHFAVGVGKYYRDYYAHEPIKAQLLSVAEIHHKPEYTDIDGLYFSDIALLILKEYIVFKSYVKPICLDYDLEYNELTVPSGWVGRVAGWGLESSHGKSSEELKVIELPAIDYHLCKNSSSTEFRPYITGDKFCAGYTNSGLSVCEGDSGGGLVFPKDIGGTTTYFLRGIVSTGANKQGSCDTDKYTTFTNIQFYLKMILADLTTNRPK